MEHKPTHIHQDYFHGSFRELLTSVHSLRITLLGLCIGSRLQVEVIAGLIIVPARS